MDIKRVAFETRPVTAVADPPVQSSMAQTPPPPQADSSTRPWIDPHEREAIAALVDRFMAARRQSPSTGEALNAASTEPPNVKEAAANNHTQAATPNSPVPPISIDKSESNGHRAVDFVCEEDVKRALAAGEKIYVNAKTIITPAARELGEQREVFAKAG
jgi:hypothetical protein